MNIVEEKRRSNKVILCTVQSDKSIEGNLQTSSAIFSSPLRHGPDLGGYKIKIGQDRIETTRFPSKADHFISISIVESPRCRYQSSNPSLETQSHSSTHKRCKRLFRLSTEAVLLHAEVTPNLALLEELEVLVCKRYIGQYNASQSIPIQSNPHSPQSSQIRVFRRQIQNTESPGYSLDRTQNTETTHLGKHHTSQGGSRPRAHSTCPIPRRRDAPSCCGPTAHG